MEMSGAETDCQCYEQLRYNNMWVKVGDCVYIQSHGLSKPRVARWVVVFFLKRASCLSGVWCDIGVV